MSDEIWFGKVRMGLWSIGQAKEHGCHQLHGDGAHVGADSYAGQLVHTAWVGSYFHVALRQLTQTVCVCVSIDTITNYK